MIGLTHYLIVATVLLGASIVVASLMHTSEIISVTLAKATGLKSVRPR